MPFRWDPKEATAVTRYGLLWAVIAAPLAVAVGSVCALFLWLLDAATRCRLENPSLLYWLPLAGVAIALCYHLWGGASDQGNNLIVDQIHEPGGGVPFRMTPLVLVSTVGTHLFGGSAGREGTAIQMGGSMASTYARIFKFGSAEHRILLMAGVAAGFGAVFGTPLAGAVFAMEVIALGRLDYAAVIPCLLASIVADKTCALWGIQHTDYHIGIFAPSLSGAVALDPALLGKVAVAGALFGLAAVLFSELAHGLGAVFKRAVGRYWMRPVIGAGLLFALAFALGTRDYLGLGVSNPDAGAITIVSSFHAGGATPWSWLWKSISTALTLGSGFKGGEVTPLFFVGSTLGNALAGPLRAPTDLLAGLGFVAVFAGAANTPLACTLMGMELFGAGQGVYIAVACFLAYLFSGHSGIYLSQRIGLPKGGLTHSPAGSSLRSARERRPSILSAWPAPSAAPRTPKAVGTLSSSPVGQLRIYVPARERVRSGGRGAKGDFLHRHLIAAARAEGLPNAAAHPAHDGGPGGRGKSWCVELVAPQKQLDQFCRRHQELLKGRILLYRSAERWSLAAGGILVEAAPPGED